MFIQANFEYSYLHFQNSEDAKLKKQKFSHTSCQLCQYILDGTPLAVIFI